MNILKFCKWIIPILGITLISCSSSGSKMPKDPTKVLQDVITIMKASQRNGTCGYFDFTFDGADATSFSSPKNVNGKSGTFSIIVTGGDKGTHSANYKYEKYSIDNKYFITGILNITKGTFKAKNAPTPAEGALKNPPKPSEIKGKVDGDLTITGPENYIAKLSVNAFNIKYRDNDCSSLRIIDTFIKSEEANTLAIVYYIDGHKKTFKIKHNNEYKTLLESLLSAKS